ncbi:molybdenum cofactor guanylyltransferase [Lentibacillus sediminis]|uniref:molybdenum cofactor guanylyltransferase n=1 Tax=Lentibacillus sediminis TaxID=1940529 RepID=UPI000C1B94F4|nr:molybdenum cofactor guanylyltransferase [Lentibacillus sediminis]
MNGKTQGVLLAGGKSRRFGSPKAFATRDGIPFYQYSIKVLAPFTDELLVITNPDLYQDFQEAEPLLDVVTDHPDYQGDGPLAGLYTAMDTRDADWYIVMPVDVPFIQGEVIERLTQAIKPETEAVIPIVGDKMQPLIAMYYYSIKERIKEQLDKGERSVYQLLQRCATEYLTLDDNPAFININRQSEYRQYIEK